MGDSVEATGNSQVFNPVTECGFTRTAFSTTKKTPQNTFKKILLPLSYSKIANLLTYTYDISLTLVRTKKWLFSVENLSYS